ncbi:MAG: hypothetical protein KDK97_11345 [Verrucomicrobiales bacterium]|nr:hypothetical protein [Verrucomicrobiales bacterium]MCP5556593.1 hypothetical protein [Verrucomicrobiaceae bacterium]
MQTLVHAADDVDAPDAGTKRPLVVWIVAGLALASGLVAAVSMIASWGVGRVALNLNVVGLILAPNLLRGYRPALYLVLAALGLSAFLGVIGGTYFLLSGSDCSPSAGLGFIVLGGISGLVFWQMCGPAVGAWFASASRSGVSLPKAFWSMLLVGLVAVVPWVVNDLSAAATLKAAYPVSVRLSVVDDQTGQPVTVPVKVESSLLQPRPSRRAVLPQLRWVGSSMAESSAVLEFAGILTGEERIMIVAKGYRSHVVTIGTQQDGREDVDVRLIPDRP